MENENLEILKEIMTEAEISVYITLFEKGRMNAAQISAETGLNRSNLYRILENLILWVRSR